MKGWRDQTVDQGMFSPEVSIRSGGAVREGFVCWLRMGAGESKFRNLEEGEKSLTKALSSQGSRYFMQISQQVQTIQLIICKAKNGNLEGLWLAYL